MASQTQEQVLVNAREGAAMCGISLRSFYNQIQRDRAFPVSVRLGKSRRWLKGELIAYLRDRCERDVPPRRNRRSA